MSRFHALYNLFGVHISLDTDSRRMAQEAELLLSNHRVVSDSKSHFQLILHEKECTHAFSGKTVSSKSGFRRYEESNQVVIETAQGRLTIDASRARAEGTVYRPSSGSRQRVESVSMVHLALLRIMAGHGFLPIHAAAIRSGNGAVLLPGNSGAGKTTMALYLAQKGFQFLGDDLAWLTENSETGVMAGAHCQPAKVCAGEMDPGMLKWERPAGDAVVEGKRLIDTARFMAGEHNRLFPLKIMVFLDRNGYDGIGETIRPMDGPEAAIHLLRACPLSREESCETGLDLFSKMRKVKFYMIRRNTPIHTLGPQVAAMLTDV